MTTETTNEVHLLTAPFITLRYGWLDENPHKSVYDGKINLLAEITIAVHYNGLVDWADSKAIREVPQYKSLVALLSKNTRFESLDDMKCFLNDNHLRSLARNIYATAPETMPDGKLRGEIHDRLRTNRLFSIKSLFMDYEVV